MSLSASCRVGVRVRGRSAELRRALLAPRGEALATVVVVDVGDEGVAFAVESGRKLFGVTSPEVAETLTALAELLGEKGEYTQKRIPTWYGPIKGPDGRWITSNVINQDVVGWVGQGRIADRTVAYLRGTKSIPVPGRRRGGDKGSLKVRGGKIFNIQNLSVDVPLGRFVKQVNQLVQQVDDIIGRMIALDHI